MKKNIRYVSFGRVVLPLKCLLWAKFNIILLCFFSIQSFAGINAQDNIKFKSAKCGINKGFQGYRKAGKVSFCI